MKDLRRHSDRSCCLLWFDRDKANLRPLVEGRRNPPEHRKRVTLKDRRYSAVEEEVAEPLQHRARLLALTVEDYLDVYGPITLGTASPDA